MTNERVKESVVTTPEVRRIREAAEQRSRTGRAEAVAAVDDVMCSRCWRPTVRKAWLCTCRPEPDWAARDAEALLPGRAA